MVSSGAFSGGSLGPLRDHSGFQALIEKYEKEHGI